MTRPPPSPLALKIAALIEATGPIGVHSFMTQALYDPKLGYYTQGNPLGAAGDFVTAPEISQMFGELLGLWAVQTWIDLGQPNRFILIELGPGRGTLMRDALRAGGAMPGFLDALHLHLVETNVPLMAQQAEGLKAYNPTWHQDLAQCPEGPTIIIGNEFLDCLPIRQYVRGPEAWHEKSVGLNDQDELCFGLGPALPHPPPCARDTDPVGSVREQAPGLASFVDDVARRLQNTPGRALFIDYGDPICTPGDTLQALHRHQKVSPLDYVGDADLTSHVDFMALGTLALQAGLRTDGPLSQANFLVALGLRERADRLASVNPQHATALQQAVERLTGMGHMGGLFHAMCLSSPTIAPPPAGF